MTWLERHNAHGRNLLLASRASLLSAEIAESLRTNHLTSVPTILYLA